MLCIKPNNGHPCGKCPNCRANQRQEWVFRLRQEFESCKFGLFVTLTYDDEHLPPLGVSKRDVQLFLKRFRKRLPPQSVRYYVVSEYGDHTHRAHYHGLFFFNLDINNLDNIYDYVRESWNNGFVSFGDIEEGSIVYCTKYCLKQYEVPAGKNQNFRLLSKMNGGIGIDYLNRQGTYHMDSQNFYSVSWHGTRSRMPRYYRTKLLEGTAKSKKLDISNEMMQKSINDLQYEAH